MKLINRRQFFKVGSAAALSSAMLPKWLRGNDCDLTTLDIVGPFYIPDSPSRTVLASPEEPGVRLFISGTIFANDCETPVEGTIIEVWHANDDGCYSINQECDTGNPDNDEFNLRGQMVSDSQGEYGFETIKPGWYMVGDNQFRPSHIHLKYTTSDGTTLITQLYFEGDPYIPDDPWASSPEAEHRIIPLEETAEGLVGEFNLFLDSNPGEVQVDLNGNLPMILALHQNYPNPFNSTTGIRYDLPVRCRSLLNIFDVNGKLVKTLIDREMSAGSYSVVWDGTDDLGNKVVSGIYFYRIEARQQNGGKVGGFAKTRKMILLK